MKRGQIRTWGWGGGAEKNKFFIGRWENQKKCLFEWDEDYITSACKNEWKEAA
jgi:hypothetical protein